MSDVPLIDIEQIVSATIATAAWLVVKGHFELAEEMRTEFMTEWGFDAEMWNGQCERLIDFAERKGAGADPAAPYRELVIA